MTTTTAAPADPPEGLPRHRRLLADEERDIRDTVRAFVAERGRCRTSATGSRRRRSRVELAPRARQARPARHAPGGLRLRRRERDRLRPGLHGARGGRQRRAQPGLGAGLAGDVRDLALGLGGAEAGVAAADGRRRGDRLLRADRARRRLGPRLDAHARAARRRRLDPATARRCGSPTARSPTSRSSGRAPTRASAASSSPRARRASRTQDIHKKLSLRASVTSRAAARRRAPARPTRCCPRRPRCAARCRA